MSSETGENKPGSIAPGMWSYAEAFSRNRGLISPEEQERLRGSRVAIIGMGGVGGVHLVTLARLGIGGFHVADPDRFELANMNRQYGAGMSTLGLPKAEVMAREAQDINPDVFLRVLPAAVNESNVGELLDGVDVLIDGIDFFALEARRLVFREARRRGIWAVTAGPLGFSAAWLVFSPTGMAFDDYFGFERTADRMEQLIMFLRGLAPAATHRPYLDLTQVDPRAGRGPSSSLACQLCAGVAASEVLKILLGRGSIRPAPWYFQFDGYRQHLVSGRRRELPWSRLQVRLMRRHLERLGWRLEGRA